MQYVTDMPIAKTLYVERLSDNKEFFVTSGYVYRENEIGGICGISKDGEKVDLVDGTYRVYRR